MKTKIYKIGSLLYYSYKTNQEMTTNALWLFTEFFISEANLYLENLGIWNHYTDLDLRFYIQHAQPTEFEQRLLKNVKGFSATCLALGLWDYITRHKPDIKNVSKLISLVNKPDKLISADISLLFMKEYTTITKEKETA